MQIEKQIEAIFQVIECILSSSHPGLRQEVADYTKYKDLEYYMEQKKEQKRKQREIK